MAHYQPQTERRNYPSAQQLRDALAIRIQVEGLEKQLSAIFLDGHIDDNGHLPGTVKEPIPVNTAPEPPRGMSALSRKRMARAMRKRWRKARETGRNSL